MRLKLEEEFNQNKEIREDEVGLRMAFEGKLNDMHKQIRDLKTDLRRSQQDLKESRRLHDESNDNLKQRIDLCKDLNQEILGHTGRITQQTQKISQLQREQDIKDAMINDYDERLNKLGQD